MDSWRQNAPALIGEFVHLGYIDETTRDAFIAMVGSLYSTPRSKREFAMRNTYLFLQTLMLLCEAQGLSTGKDFKTGRLGD